MIDIDQCLSFFYSLDVFAFDSEIEQLSMSQIIKPNGGAETNLVSRCDQELIKLLGARFEPI